MITNSALRAQLARCKLMLQGFRPTPGTAAYHAVERLITMRTERTEWYGVEDYALMHEIDLWLTTSEARL